MRIVLGKTSGLAELCDKLNRVHAWCAERGMSVDELEMPSLPTFGGEEPDDDRALSWDADDMLARDWDGSFMLVPRPECSGPPPSMFWSAYAWA